MARTKHRPLALDLSKYRNFKGKRYELHSVHVFKRNALQELRKLHKEGYLARVVEQRGISERTLLGGVLTQADYVIYKRKRD